MPSLLAISPPLIRETTIMCVSRPYVLSIAVYGLLHLHLIKYRSDCSYLAEDFGFRAKISGPIE